MGFTIVTPVEQGGVDVNGHLMSGAVIRGGNFAQPEPQSRTVAITIGTLCRIFNGAGLVMILLDLAKGNRCREYRESPL
jgi:hypothetical protein